MLSLYHNIVKQHAGTALVVDGSHLVPGPYSFQEGKGGIPMRIVDFDNDVKMQR